MHDLRDIRIAVIGLGYVGLPLAIEFARHFDTLGYDIDRHRIERLRAGEDGNGEAGADELAAVPRLGFTSELDALRACNVYIVTVPTPVDAHKRPVGDALLPRCNDRAPT